MAATCAGAGLGSALFSPRAGSYTRRVAELLMCAPPKPDGVAVKRHDPGTSIHTPSVLLTRRWFGNTRNETAREVPGVMEWQRWKATSSLRGRRSLACSSFVPTGGTRNSRTTCKCNVKKIEEEDGVTLTLALRKWQFDGSESIPPFTTNTKYRACTPTC